MVVSIRKYKPEDIIDMIRIWKKKVLRFHKRSFLMRIPPRYFLIRRPTAEWRRMPTAKYMDCIFSIQTMLAGAVISATQAMPSVPSRADCI